MATQFELAWDVDPDRTPSQATLLEQVRYYQWYIMHFLLGAAAAGGMTQGLWTTLGSSDAVTAGLDGVDRWGSTFDATKIVRAAAGVAHSWYVVQSPVSFGDNTGPYYIIFDFSTGVDSLVNVVWSKNAPTGGTTLNRPTAVGEWTNTNQQFAQNPLVASRVHGLLASTGDFAVFHNPAAAASVFPFCISARTLYNVAVSTDVVRMATLCDFLAGGQGALERTQIVTTLLTNKIQTKNFDNTATIQLGAVSPSVNIAANTQLFAVPNLSVVDAASGAYDDFSVWLYSFTAANLTIKGRIPDFCWIPDGAPMAAVEPTAGPPYASMKVANFWFPWPASAQPTGFALNEISRSQSASGGALAGGGGTTYIMEAIDSVTLGLFHWNSGTTPDFAGVGYPGPNAPTLIAISQVN